MFGQEVVDRFLQHELVVVVKWVHDFWVFGNGWDFDG